MIVNSNKICKLIIFLIIIPLYNLNKMDKTAAVALQSIGMKLGTLPIYTEISSVAGTDQYQFITKVSWRNYIAEGAANNKKEAKQNAAKKMLSLLLSSNEISEKMLSPYLNPKTDCTLNTSSRTSDVHSINLSEPATKQFMNYIGLLNEYCQTHNLSSPIYEDVAIAGPSHLPMFTVRCSIGNVHCEGCANTKRAAKHAAAKKILENLENYKLNTETSNTIDNLNAEYMKVSLDQSNHDKLQQQKIVAVYGQLKKEPALFKPCIKIDDYVETLRDLCRILMKNAKSLNIHNISLCTNTNALKDVIYKMFKISVKEISFNTISGNSLLGIKLDTHPVIFQFGMGKTIEQARKIALLKVIEYISLLSQ